jgi:hypothetical protein
VLASNQDLARKLARHDQEIRSLYKLVKALLEPSEVKKGHRIGFIASRD